MSQLTLDLVQGLIDRIDPAGLMSEVRIKSQEAQNANDAEAQIGANIYKLKQTKKEIEGAAYWRVRNMTADELKDPTTGKSNVKHSERLVEDVLAKDEEYQSVMRELTLLESRRIIFKADAENATIAWIEVRTVSDIARDWMNLLASAGSSR